MQLRDALCMLIPMFHFVFDMQGLLHWCTLRGIVAFTEFFNVSFKHKSVAEEAVETTLSVLRHSQSVVK